MAIHPDVMKAALSKLLAHGEAASDAKLMRMADKKKAPTAEAMCPDCKVPMVDGKCPDCGKEAGAEDAGEGDLAELLEQGAKE